MRVGINGFGRMGRLALRAGWDAPDLEFVHVNEIAGDARDVRRICSSSTRSTAAGRDVIGRGRRTARRSTAPRSASRRVAEPGDVAVGRARRRRRARVLGAFRTREALAPYFARGVREGRRRRAGQGRARSTSSSGVNDDRYDPDVHDIVTAASCTTNCLAPVVKVIHEGIGIRHGSITTLHDMTNTQTVVDAPHKDLRRARAAALSLIPTTTGSATAIGLIFPELEGRLERPRGARAAAERLADRLRLRGRAADDRRGGQRAAARRRRRAARGHPRLRGAAARLGRLPGRPALGDRRRALDDGRRRHAGEDPRLVRQRVGLREPARRAGGDSSGSRRGSARGS